MNAKKLAQIRRDLAAARRKPQTQSDLASIAVQLGRVRYTKKGKEPTWISSLPGTFPLSIPNAKGGDLRPGTKKSVLNQLDDDVLTWSEILQEQEDGA